MAARLTLLAAMIAALFALLMAMNAGPVQMDQAQAHDNNNGPHNHNGNSTLDYYWTDDFNGHVGNAIDDFNDTPDSGNMPEARRVLSRSAADVEIFYDNSLNNGAFFAWTHGAAGPDEIHVGPNYDPGPYNESPFAHEMFHSYDGEHITSVSICSNLVGGSVMCVQDAREYNPKHLTLHDSSDLRHLPNKWQGGPVTAKAPRDFRIIR